MTQELKIMLGIGVISIAILIGAVFFFGSSQSPSNSSQPSVDPGLLVRNDSHMSATASATVTLVEFGDYQCPSCKAFHPVITQLQTDYPGNLRFVFRHFPLPMHNNALIAAQAAEAAGAQGKFWQMHVKLYENQNDWAENKEPIGLFNKYASELGLDIKQFQEDLETQKYKKRVQDDQSDGYVLKVNATPTVFINNLIVKGSLSYNDLKKLIDQELAVE